MDKKKFKNLMHSFRWMCRRTTKQEALAWIGFYSQENMRLIKRLM